MLVYDRLRVDSDRTRVSFPGQAAGELFLPVSAYCGCLGLSIRLDRGVSFIFGQIERHSERMLAIADYLLIHHGLIEIESVCLSYV